MMDDRSPDSLDDVRALAARLLASVEASERQLTQLGAFRYRLIRGHALAMLDEIEELAREASDSGSHCG